MFVETNKMTQILTIIFTISIFGLAIFMLILRINKPKKIKKITKADIVDPEEFKQLEESIQKLGLTFRKNSLTTVEQAVDSWSKACRNVGNYRDFIIKKKGSIGVVSKEESKIKVKVFISQTEEVPEFETLTEFKSWQKTIKTDKNTVFKQITLELFNR